MAVVTGWVGVALMCLGVGGYMLTHGVSWTALIPAAFGVMLLLLGAWGRDERRRKTAMHVAVAVGLLGLAGSARGLMSLPTLLSGGNVERPAAVYSQSMMALVLSAYLVLAIRSFVRARRGRATQP